MGLAPHPRAPVSPHGATVAAQKCRWEALCQSPASDSLPGVAIVLLAPSLGPAQALAGCPTHILLQENLRQYVDRIFNIITKSGVSCPTVMCDIFFSLREAAAKRFQGESSVRVYPQPLTGWLLLPLLDGTRPRSDVQSPHKGDCKL